MVQKNKTRDFPHPIHSKLFYESKSRCTSWKQAWINKHYTVNKKMQGKALSNVTFLLSNTNININIKLKVYQA